MGNGVLSPQVETLDVFVELFSGIESETHPVTPRTKRRTETDE